MYNRYKSFTSDNGKSLIVPFIEIKEKSTDKFVYWRNGFSRLDIISHQFYGDSGYGWLILQANPQLPSVEFLIEDGERIRVPYPLESTINQYENSIQLYRAIESSQF